MHNQPNNGLKVLDVYKDHLFFKKCDCGELTVYGFWHQLEGKEFNKKDKVARIPMKCDGCQTTTYKYFRLTKGNGYPRLINWFAIVYALSYAAGKWSQEFKLWVFRNFGMAAIWLDRRVKL